jgi:hypothetical protein
MRINEWRTNFVHGCLMKRQDYEVTPGDRALVSGVYELLDAFGTPTATKLFIMQGSEAPAASRSFKWRLIEPAGTTYQAASPG